MWILGALGLAALVGLATSWRRMTIEVAALLALCWLMIIGRVLLFALVDASSYPLINQASYLLPAAGLLPFSLAIAVGLPSLGRTRTASPEDAP